MPPSNVELTAVILDVGFSAAEKKDDSPSFFEKSVACALKIIERKILSRPNDVMSFILLGSEETNNNLSIYGNAYQHISIAIDFTSPTWDLLEMIHDKVKPSKHTSNWFKSLEVAADCINGSNIKCATKKVVLMTDLKSYTPTDDEELQKVIDIYSSSGLQLIVIGPDIWINERESEPSESLNNKSEQQLKSELLLKKIISANDDMDDVNGVIVCDFSDTMEQLKFFKRRTTNPSPWNVNLTIGESISIPVTGFSTIRDDKTIGQWKKSYKDPDSNNSSTIEAVRVKKTYFKKSNNTEEVDELDVINGYVYGQTIVPFTKLEDSMIYKSNSPRCLSIFGFTKESNIHWNYLVGDGVTYIVPRKGDENAKIALNAFIVALKKLNHVAIARKIYNQNNMPHMTVLFPIVEDDSKCLSMIHLAFEEDYRYLSFPSLNKKAFAYTDEQAETIDELINSMDLSETEFSDEYFPVGKVPNPSLQYTFDVIAHRAMYPKNPLPEPRSEILELLMIPPLISKSAMEPLEKISKLFELISKEKPKRKEWLTKKFKDEVIKESDETLNIKNERITPLSVLSSQTTTVGTIAPINDFKELYEYGEPFDSLSDQMKEVIERLVFLTLGDNYSKPLSVITFLREACASNDPNSYNKWLVDFKAALIERSRKEFLELLFKNQLGLITNEENSLSLATETEIERFNFIPTNDVSMDIKSFDTTEIDELFDD